MALGVLEVEARIPKVHHRHRNALHWKMGRIVTIARERKIGANETGQMEVKRTAMTGIEKGKEMHTRILEKVRVPTQIRQ